MPRGTHVNRMLLTIDSRMMANMITRTFGISDDGSLVVTGLEQVFDHDDPDPTGFEIQMERRPELSTDSQ